MIGRQNNYMKYYLNKKFIVKLIEKDCIFFSKRK